MNVDLKMGEVVVAKGADRILAPGIGSCVVIAVYDRKNRIGGAAHTVLSAPGGQNLSWGKSAYVGAALDEMLARMIALGADRKRLEAKLIGGANMFSAYKVGVGESTLSRASEKLATMGIPIVGECIGGSQGRSVEFSLATGIVEVKTKI